MKHSSLRRVSAAAVAALTLALGAASASADDIANNLDGSIDAIAEVMPLTVGGAAASTTFYVQPTGDGNTPADGKSGCNLTGSTTLVVAVISSDPGKATVSPSSLTFGSCGDVKQVTVTPVAAGSSTVTLSQTSNNSGGTFSFAPATFTVNVAGAAPTNTAPTVAVVGVTGGTAYEYGAVPTATCVVADAEDGASSFGATLSAVTGPLAEHGLGQQTASCSYTDRGGLTATSSVTYSIVDTTAPVITFVSQLPAANTAGWNNADVTVTWSCSDNVAIDAATSTTSVTLSSEGANQIATSTCTDVSGNDAAATVTGINIDKTAPTITAALTPDRASSGWWNATTGAPTVTYTCSDATSGLAAGACPGSHTFGEGENQSHSGTVSDVAGNSATDGVSDVDVDLTAPGVTWVDGPADESRHYFRSVPAEGTCTATDDLSGPDDCKVTGYGTGVGAHTMTATPHDNAGNTTTANREYEVLAWTLKGFYQPVDMSGVLNTVKNGSTVPLKFEVFAGATELTDTSAVMGFTVKGVACPSSAVVTDDIEMTSTGSTELRYDTTGGQFIQNWQTPKKAGACYIVTMKTQDGSTISANFKLK